MRYKTQADAGSLSNTPAVLRSIYMLRQGVPVAARACGGLGGHGRSSTRRRPPSSTTTWIESKLFSGTLSEEGVPLAHERAVRHGQPPRSWTPSSSPRQRPPGIENIKGHTQRRRSCVPASTTPCPRPVSRLWSSSWTSSSARTRKFAIDDSAFQRAGGHYGRLPVLRSSGGHVLCVAIACELRSCTVLRLSSLLVLIGVTNGFQVGYRFRIGVCGVIMMRL